jgi:hypothetical protein
MKKRTNTKKGITKKHVMLQHRKDRMQIEIKGYAKPACHTPKLLNRFKCEFKGENNGRARSWGAFFGS